MAASSRPSKEDVRDGGLNSFGAVDVANSDLKSSHVPRAGCALGEVMRFAYTFDGYLHAGCPELARAMYQQQRVTFNAGKEMIETLSEARIGLFVAARHLHWDHEGSVQSVEPFMRRLVEIVADKIAEGSGAR